MLKLENVVTVERERERESYTSNEVNLAFVLMRKNIGDRLFI